MALVNLLVYVEPKNLLLATPTLLHANATDKQLHVQTTATIVLPNDLPPKNAWVHMAVPQV